jgi:hypothetical protein
MAGLEKEVHRSTDRVHSEKVGTSLGQNGAAATGCLTQLYVRGYHSTDSSLRQKRVLVNYEWGTLVEKYQCKGYSRWSLGCSMLHKTLVGVSQIWKMSYPCDRDAGGDNGARAEWRSLLFLISHLMGALMQRGWRGVTVGKPHTHGREDF